MNRKEPKKSTAGKKNAKNQFIPLKENNSPTYMGSNRFSF
jgi:hypothetical protein